MANAAEQGIKSETPLVSRVSEGELLVLGLDVGIGKVPRVEIVDR